MIIPDHKFVIKTYLTLMKGLKVSSWPMVDGIVGKSFSLLAYTRKKKKINVSALKPVDNNNFVSVIAWLRLEEILILMMFPGNYLPLYYYGYESYNNIMTLYTIIIILPTIAHVILSLIAELSGSTCWAYRRLLTVYSWPQYTCCKIWV